MAAATENPSLSTTPQDILKEVNRFLRGTTYDNKIGEEGLAQSALFLLRSMPAARHAVLEHFCSVFDDAVNTHLLQRELGQSVTGQDETVKVKEGILQDISGVLLSFIQVNPEAWAPIISAWSLELLGHISCKYAEKRGMTHSSSLNDVLQLWMTCFPTKLLMELATECFAAMVGGAPDICVDALLEASVKYTPHFDWVVAHIGSCFPKMIISRVLNCGLKDFCSLGSEHSEKEMSSSQKLPKMASVVGILGHLASKHGQDIRRALMHLFEESLEEGSDLMRVKTVPFLLQLASMSQMLLQVLTTDIIKALTPDVLNKLHLLFSKWKIANPKEFASLLSLVVHLTIKSDVGGFDVIKFLITYAAPKQSQDGKDVSTQVVKEVQDTCHELMDKLIYEIQHTVNSRKKNMPNQDMPLLRGLAVDVHRLLKLLIDSEGQSHLWAQQVLTFVALYSGESCAATILSGVIAQSVRPMQSTVFLRLQRGIEVGIPNLITTTMQYVFDLLRPHASCSQLRLLKNLLFLLQWEKKTTAFKTKTTSSQLRKCLENHLTPLSSLLGHPDPDISSTVLQILSNVQIPQSLHTPVLLQLSASLIHAFFTFLHYTDDSKVLKSIRLCKNCFRALCYHSSAQCMLIQMLVEGAVTQENASLFGGKMNINSQKKEKGEQTSIFTQNQQLSVSMNMHKSASSVFHAGVIGQGRKPPPIRNQFSQEQISCNTQNLIDALLICCQETVARNDEHEPMETEEKQTRSEKIDEIAARMLSSVLVELATPDMLYNDTHWPEEEFLRISLERDLLVWKQMENNPILWNIFSAFSHCSSVVCFLSPVLRCIMGTVLNHFDNSREKLMKNSPKYFEASCRLVRSLSRGRMLPHPLCHVVDLFDFVSPYEGYLLLLSIWRYIKENPPTMSANDLDQRLCDAKHIDVIRAIIHANINNMGHLYPRFFDRPIPVKQE